MVKGEISLKPNYSFPGGLKIVIIYNCIFTDCIISSNIYSIRNPNYFRNVVFNIKTYLHKRNLIAKVFAGIAY